ERQGRAFDTPATPIAAPKEEESAMVTRHHIASVGRWLSAGAGIAAASYATLVAITWYRYGYVTHQAGGEDTDALLDNFMPTYDVSERHQVRIAAPAAIT